MLFATSRTAVDIHASVERPTLTALYATSNVTVRCLWVPEGESGIDADE